VAIDRSKVSSPSTELEEVIQIPAIGRDGVGAKTPLSLQSIEIRLDQG
jgi:hypothetical protein